VIDTTLRDELVAKIHIRQANGEQDDSILEKLIICLRDENQAPDAANEAIKLMESAKTAPVVVPVVPEIQEDIEAAKQAEDSLFGDQPTAMEQPVQYAQAIAEPGEPAQSESNGLWAPNEVTPVTADDSEDTYIVVGEEREESNEDEDEHVTVDGEETDYEETDHEDTRIDLIVDPNNLPLTMAIATKMISLGAHCIFFKRGLKKCTTMGWQDLATRDLVKAAQLIENIGIHCNVGVVGKPDGLWFFDDDKFILDEYERQYGRISTYRARSCSGGTHLYFKQNDLSRATGNINGTAPDGTESWSARILNRYVVSAGSSAHPDNDPNLPEYYYTCLENIPVTEAPASFIEFLKMKSGARNPRQDDATIPKQKIAHGGIHNFMLSQAGKLRAMGLDAAEIEEPLLALVHKHCEPPIDESLVRQMAHSICKFPPGGPTDIDVSKAALPVNGVYDLNGERVMFDQDEVAQIPEFDPSIIKGIYKDIVDLTTRGTTLAPQFIYAITKAVVGTKMAGKVKLQDLDVEPLTYLALCGQTGAGKGEAWRRVLRILNATIPGEIKLDSPLSSRAGIKIVNSADSGAGLKDAFFEFPESQPIICYIDEVSGLGHKAGEKKNPEIIDTMGELADSTSISRVKAKKGKQSSTKTKDNAYLTVVMCGQNQDVFIKAFTGRTDVGWFDRLVPEFGVPQETGKLPQMGDQEASKMLARLNGLDYSGEMTKAPDADRLLEQFWLAQEPEVRKVARLKKQLLTDVFLIAFGRGSKIAELADVEDAIKGFTRSLVIRKAMFHGEAPSQIGFYLGKIKGVTEWMRAQIAAGFPEASVAMSWSDYETKTNARRNNEEDIFKRAMVTHAEHHLMMIKVRAKNGHVYEKYVPVPLEG
jgi:hypothetical protein